VCSCGSIVLRRWPGSPLSDHSSPSPMMFRINGERAQGDDGALTNADSRPSALVFYRQAKERREALDAARLAKKENIMAAAVIAREKRAVKIVRSPPTKSCLSSPWSNFPCSCGARCGRWVTHCCLRSRCVKDGISCPAHLYARKYTSTRKESFPRQPVHGQPTRSKAPHSPRVWH
jgi:hypothetical protein